MSLVTGSLAMLGCGIVAFVASRFKNSKVAKNVEIIAISVLGAVSLVITMSYGYMLPIKPIKW
jgi:hypothetical protein